MWWARWKKALPVAIWPTLAHNEGALLSRDSAFKEGLPMTGPTEKKRRAMPAIFACCALACTLLASGCAQSFSDAAQALNDGVKADMAQLTELTSDSATTLFASDYTDELVSAGVDPLDVYGPMFASLSYDVSSISIEDNTAHVTVSISNKDLNQVFQDYTAQVTNELASSATRDALAAMDDDALTAHLAQILEQCLANPDVPLVTQSVELVYVKDGSTWKLQDSDALVQALLGGLDPEQASVASADKLVTPSDAGMADAQAADAVNAADGTTQADAQAAPAADGSEGGGVAADGSVPAAGQPAQQ